MAPDRPGEPVNRRLLLIEYPEAALEERHFTCEYAPVPRLEDGQFLVRNRIISLDPAMRGWASPTRSYIPPVPIGGVMRALAGGEIVESCHPDYPVGIEVTGLFGLQDYAVSDGTGVRPKREGFDLDQMLGPLGVSGLTAYFGLLDVAQAKPGALVLVSAAAGAVGSAVVQIARNIGCRVVGIAGGTDKCAFVRSLGAEACIDYKVGDVARAVRAACPTGIDVFFDNVGGAILEAALRNLKNHARIAICGAISQYNALRPAPLEAYLALLATRSTMRGFVLFDYADRHDEAEERIAGWIAEGRFSYRLDHIDGLLNAPPAISRLFDGSNRGKLLVRVEADGGRTLAGA